MTDSPFTSKRGLIQLKPLTPQTPSRGLDISMKLTPNIFGNSYLDASSVGSRSIRACDFLSETQLQQTLFKEKTDSLFAQFLEVLQGRTNEADVFDTIQELIHACSSVWEEIQREYNREVAFDPRQLKNAVWLEQEVKTWKLLFALYKDRIKYQNEGSNEDECIALVDCSEKEAVTQLYTCNSLVREYQLIVDWLEATFDKPDTGPDVRQSTERTFGWENTLNQLQSQREIPFSTGAEIVKSLDPDAPIRERRPLHAIDEEDNLQLSKCIFYEIRQGNIDEAKSLCNYRGQPWRAALLEGWRVYEDPNYAMYQNVHEKLPIEGNPRRDIWKKCAWLMAESKKFDEYTRAISGAFCGHLESLKSLLTNSWEDLLWAYLKVQIDIRVETEIRACCTRPYLAMPDAYWNSKMSMQSIFDELAVHNDLTVREYASSKIGIIQKYLILDNIPELLQIMQGWVESDSGASNININAAQATPPHFLRFLAHIILFMRQIGRVEKDEIADSILVAYVETLIRQGEPQLVAFYTATLPEAMQIQLYSKFLEGITESTARSLALEQALLVHLDIERITQFTVDTIRQRMPNADEQNMNITERPQAGDISEFDLQKISSLEWLTFLPSQVTDLLWQANAMIRHYLIEGKSECVRNAFNIVPTDCLKRVAEIYGSLSDLPHREDCIIREYTAFRVYLFALDKFEDWSNCFYNRPKEPELVESTNFTERIASEHKEQTYRSELNRWKISLEDKTKITCAALQNILLFPEEAWLTDREDESNNVVEASAAEWEARQTEMAKLRSIVIPEITLLLHKVMHLTEDYKGCVRLSELLASDTHQLYKAYTKHKMAELLSKIAESSLEMLKSKLDPWGFPTTY